MKKTKKAPFPLGTFLKELREKKGVSLMEVEKALKIPNAYISQLETGARRKLPEADRLRTLADYYNVTVEEFLAKAGYYEEKNVIEDSYEAKINRDFMHIIYNPQFHTGRHINPDSVPLDVQRFVVEMFSYKPGTHPPTPSRVAIEDDKIRFLHWKILKVTRDTIQKEKQSLIHYQVTVECTETTGVYDKKKPAYNLAIPGTEKVTDVASGEGAHDENAGTWQGYEAKLLARATNIAIQNALSKFKDKMWSISMRLSTEML